MTICNPRPERNFNLESDSAIGEKPLSRFGCRIRRLHSHRRGHYLQNIFGNTINIKNLPTEGTESSGVVSTSEDITKIRNW